MRNLNHIKNILFDCDGVLYSDLEAVFGQVSRKMTEYISSKLNVDLKKAKELQTNYFHKYNTSLNGLMIHHEIDPKEFLDFVHDIDLSFLEKDTALRYGYHEQCRVIEGGMSAHDVANSINKALKKYNAPTAIFASNEYAALGVLSALSKNNVQIPGQISVITFDDANWTNILNPAVTVLQQPIKEMARLAWRNMKTFLRGESIENRFVKLNGKLVIRESVLTKRERGKKIVG